MITDYKRLRKKYTNDPDDPVILEEYCDFLKEYLSQGFMEKQMEQIYRNQYTQLLLKTAGTKGESPYLCLPDGKSYGAKGIFFWQKKY